MSEIKQLLLLHQQGKGKKTITKALGMSRNTVRSYLRKLDALCSQTGGSHSIEDLVKLEDPLLEAKFHPGNPAYKDDRYDELKGYLEGYLSDLKLVGVNKHLLWQEYQARHPEGYRYSQFCFHLKQHQLAAKPHMVLAHQPAEKLFIDLAGKKLHYIDKETGEQVSCYVFVACLPYSDYSFAMAIESQSTEDFLYALSCCLEDLGGVPKALVPDNLKAAVTKADRYEPGINRVMEDFANHYGTTVVPARVRKPQDKALVENQVKLIYTRVYAKLRHMQFFDLSSLNEAIRTKVKAHNQTRMQQKPFCRAEKFLAEEKGLLMALPAERFTVKKYSEHKVAKNNHIYLSEDKHYYSVPYQLIGTKVKVIYTRQVVKIFSKGQQIAIHLREFGQGKYTTQHDHLCSQHQQYRDRSPDYYKLQARKKSSTLHELIKLIFDQNKYPEQLYRTCDGLFGLHRKTDLTPFDKACQIAIDQQVYSYTFIKNILENRMTEELATPVDPQPLPAHDNLRGKDYYLKQMEIQFNKHESN